MSGYEAAMVGFKAGTVLLIIGYFIRLVLHSANGGFEEDG